MRQTILIGVTAIALAFGAAGSAPAQDPAALAGDSTLAVMRIDVTAIDIDAAAKGVQAILDKAAKGDDPHAAMARAFPPMGAAMAKPWVEAFRKAGGTELWAMVDVQYIPKGFVLVAIPLAEGADADTLANLVEYGRPNAPAGAKPLLPLPVKKAHGGLLLLGGEAIVADAVKRIEARAAVRPGVAAALKEASGAVRIALAPSDLTRRVWREMLPPIEELPGLSGEALAAGMQWVSVSLQPGETISIAATMQSADAKAADAMLKIYEAAWKRMEDEGERQRMGADLDTLRDLLKPTRTGSQLKLAFDEGRLTRVGSIFLGAARTEALRQTRLGTARMLATAIHGYRGEKKSWPESIQDLLDAQFIPASANIAGGPWIYLKPLEQGKDANLTRLMVIHESFTDWPSAGLVVGFADGHVEWIQTKAHFDRLMKQREEKDK